MAAEPGAAEAAPAKVNLYLHLRGRRADGYHLLESLAVFPGVGDRLRAAHASALSLALEGPFGAALASDPDNLVLRAARALATACGVTAGAALALEKNLPVASGIGGGSADAAAALRLLARLWGVEVPPGLAETLGADVPVCMTAPEPRLMAGAGEVLAVPRRLPGFWMVLVNPGEAVATAAVFRALARRDNPPGPAMPGDGFADFAGLIAWLGEQRNDMQEAAKGLCPAIGTVLEALGGAPLVRMSGSGATCFALHETESAARMQAGALRAAHPGWWVAAAPVAAWG